MAIEIIKEGLSLHDVPYDGTCPNCKTVLKWTHEDVYCAETAHEHEVTPFCQIKCPVCKSDVIGVLAKIIPDAIETGYVFRDKGKAVATDGKMVVPRGDLDVKAKG